MSEKSISTEEEKAELFLAIAKKWFNMDTLETRNSDRLDFKDCAVWSIKAALLEAFNAGVMAGIQQKEKNNDKKKQTRKD